MLRRHFLQFASLLPGLALFKSDRPKLSLDFRTWKNGDRFVVPLESLNLAIGEARKHCNQPLWDEHFIRTLHYKVRDLRVLSTEPLVLSFSDSCPGNLWHRSVLLKVTEVLTIEVTGSNYETYPEDHRRLTSRERHAEWVKENRLKQS